MAETETPLRDATPAWDGFDPAIVRRSQILAVDGATPYQALIGSLLAETVTAYRQRSSFRMARRSMSWAIAGPVVAGATYAVMGLARWMIDLAGIRQADSVLVGLAGVIVLMALASRRGASSRCVDLSGHPRVNRLKLGSWEAATDLRRIVRYLLMVALLYGLQTSLLQFAEIGFDEQYGFLDSLLLTLDNMLHGVLFDFCELYGIHFGPEWEHNARTATVFLVFRIAFDGLIGVSLYLWYRSHEVQQIIKECPEEITRRSELCVWIDDVLRDKANWTREFGAECVFLQMVRAHLENRFEDVIELARVLPAVQITPTVCNLFRDANGKLILATTEFQNELDPQPRNRFE
jgi:hypothetical protein